MFVILTFVSIGHLLFGYLPESATLMIFGICMIGLAIGLRRFLKHHEETKTEKDILKGKK